MEVSDFALDDFWRSKLAREFIIERCARRLVAKGLDEIARNPKIDPEEQFFLLDVWLSRAVQAVALPMAIHGMEQGFDGRSFASAPPYIDQVLAKLEKAVPQDNDLFRLRVRFNHGDALKEAHARLTDPKRPDADKVKLIQLLGQVRRPQSLPVLVGLFHNAKSDAIRGAALTAAQSFGDPKVLDELLTEFPKLNGGLRQQALGILLSRPATTLTVLHQVDAKKIDPKSIPVEQLRPVLDFKNPEIEKLVIKHWGKIGHSTPGEKMARIAWLNTELGRGKGYVASGKVLFTKNCAVCHTLFGEGAKIGPDLTTADRKNRTYLLTHIVDPSLYIRPEFMSYNVTTLDGRRLSGLVSDATDASVTLNNYIENKIVKTVVSKKDIDEMLPSAVSLMPEKQLDTMSYQEVRDLFAYLQSAPPANAGGSPKQGSLKQASPKQGSPRQASLKQASPKQNPASLPRKRGENPAKKLTILLISGSLEYKSDETLPILQKYLEANYPVECLRTFRKTDEDLPGLEQLDKCDVAVFFTRRLKITGEQLERIKKYATSGKPIVAIRTASHGFQNWLAMDKEVFGGDYGNHYGAGPKCEVKITKAGEKHPILAGVKPWKSEGSLYKNQHPANDITVLMTGSIPDHIGANRLGPRLQGGTNLLHLARPPEGF